MRIIEIADTGSATANHFPQSSWGSISWRAIRFWGEEMGELWPPMFAANAIPSYSIRLDVGEAGRILWTYDKTRSKL